MSKGGWYQHILGVIDLTPCRDFTDFEADSTSKLCIRYSKHHNHTHLSIHIFGTHASDGGCPLALTHAVIGDASICGTAWSITFTDSERG